MEQCRQILRRILIVAAYAAFWALAVWGMGVVFYCLHLGWVGLVIYIAAIASCVWFRKNHYAKYGACTLVAALTVYYMCIPASNDRAWQASWSQMPYAILNDNMLTISNIRDFSYRTPTDFDVKYITKTYDLNKLDSLYFATSHWDGIKVVSHTLVSFGFSDGEHLALSVETRLDKNDQQGTIAGLFKQFELLFIFATEQDLFALRTNYRHEDLYLYQVKETDPAVIRKILLDFTARANDLTVHPQYYNTVTNNCTTALRPSLKLGLQKSPAKFNAFAILNGYIDEKAFKRGWLDARPGEQFEDLKKRSLIPYGTAKDDPENYSKKIREIINSR